MGREYLTMNLVRFACTSSDKIVHVALTEDALDDWMTGEPPEGYHMCEQLGEVQVEIVPVDRRYALIFLFDLFGAELLDVHREYVENVIDLKGQPVCDIGFQAGLRSMLDKAKAALDAGTYKGDHEVDTEVLARCVALLLLVTGEKE